MAIRTQSRTLFESKALPHLPALYNFALALAGASDAEDLVQTTCVRALENLDAYRPGTNIRAWLFTILRNEWVSRYRRSGRIRRSLIRSRDALQQLTPAQRRRWVALQTQQTP